MSAIKRRLSAWNRPGFSQPAASACAIIPVLVFILMASGCGSLPDRNSFISSDDGAPVHTVDIAAIPDAVPRIEPRSRYGNPSTYIVNGKRYHVRDNSTAFRQQGTASWYGTKFHGRKTSSGEPYDMFSMTAAHKTLPLPTWLEVINNDNQRRIIVKVNDRGPFVDDRIIDLSYAAAAKLGIIATGTADVTITAIDPELYLAEKKRQQPAVTVVSNISLPPELATPPSLLPQAATAAGPEGTSPAMTAVADAAATATNNSTAVDGKAAGQGKPSSANNGFYLQVAAFSDIGNAEQLRQRLLPLESGDIQIDTGQRAGHPLYRVRIGPLASLSEAGRIAARITSLGLGEPRIMLD